MLYVNTKRGDGVVVHNTVLQAMHDRNPVALTDPAFGDREDVRVQFTHNIVGMSEHTTNSYFMRVDLPPAVPYTKETAGTTIVAAFDNNAYMNLEAGAAMAVNVANRLTLAEWQAQTSFDANSSDGEVPGVTVPNSTLYADPRLWTAENPAYMAHFTPDSDWAECAGADTPGAVDCQGNRIGLGVIEPFSEFTENDGFGMYKRLYSFHFIV